jgi:8-oxo-dGTP pyrophosphatase MutT (NUDIX family)
MNKEQVKLDLIDLLSKTNGVKEETLQNFKDLIKNQPNDFWGKKSNDAHITASSLVVNEDLTEVLLTHHKKLKKWLQLGGHWCDFEDFPSKTVLEAAMKEVEEEGYGDKKIPQNVLIDGVPLDLDIHSVGDHSHYDVCFLTQVNKSVPVDVSEESHDVKWITIDEIIDPKNQYEDRLVEMCKKVKFIVNPEKIVKKRM